jgi:hypothetical protein
MKPMGFELIGEARLDLTRDALPPRLAHLLAYWREKRAARAMPSRVDIDPVEFAANLGRIHLLVVEAPNTFRYRIYGSNVTNPDAADMTGRTTLDYLDRAFGAMVTRHLAASVTERQPICWHVRARLDAQPYEYCRIALPLSADDTQVDMLLVGTERGAIPDSVMRSLPSKYR